MTLTNHLQNPPQQTRTNYTYIYGIIGLALFALTISCGQATHSDAQNQQPTQAQTDTAKQQPWTLVPFGQSKFMKPGRIRARTEDQFYLLYRYSGFSFSGIDVMFANDIFSDIREFYPEVLRKGLMKHLK